jgi:hypothetical protein
VKIYWNVSDMRAAVAPCPYRIHEDNNVRLSHCTNYGAWIY